MLLNLILLIDGTPKELFTIESFSTLAGLTGMVYVASNALQRAFNFNPKWFAFVLAQGLTLFTVCCFVKEPETPNYIIAVFNGFLVYLSASGGTSATAQLLRNEPIKALDKNERRRFSSPWW